MTHPVITLASTPANDTTHTATGIAPRSIKDLLCDACGRAEAVRDGYCAACRADIEQHLDGGAAYFVGDDEGELLARGVSTDDGGRFV